MKNSEIQYQPLLTDDHKQINNNKIKVQISKHQHSFSKSTEKLFTFQCCSKLAFVFVIVVFVALYFLTTLEISFASTKRQWKKPFFHDSQLSSQSTLLKQNVELQEKLLKPLSELVDKLSKSVNKLDQNTDKNLSSILPARVQLNDFQTMELVENESNLPATYWNRWSKPRFGKQSLKKDAKYCPSVNLSPPHEVMLQKLN